jgi:hypothetical protein
MIEKEKNRSARHLMDALSRSQDIRDVLTGLQIEYFQTRHEDADAMLLSVVDFHRLQFLCECEKDWRWETSVDGLSAKTFRGMRIFRVIDKDFRPMAFKIK